MLNITNEIDAEYFVDAKKIERFIEDSDTRASSLREFYKNRGVFIFADDFDGLKKVCPNFVLNFTSADSLNAMTGRKVYPTICGFYLTSEREMDLEGLKELLENRPSGELESEGILVSIENNIDDGCISGKIRYRYERLSALFFPERLVGFNFKIRKSKEDNTFIVTGEIVRGKDYKNLREVFSQSYLRGNKIEIFDLKFNRIANTELHHQTVSEMLSSMDDVNLAIQSKTTPYECIGSFEHRSRKVGDVPVENQLSCFETSGNILWDGQLKSSETLIDELETQAGHRLIKLKGLLFSEQANTYLDLTFGLEGDLSITYNSTREIEQSEEVPAEITHPTNKEELHNLRRVVLSEDEIIKILEKLWLKTSESVYQTLSDIE